MTVCYLLLDDRYSVKLSWMKSSSTRSAQWLWRYLRLSHSLARCPNTALARVRGPDACAGSQGCASCWSGIQSCARCRVYIVRMPPDNPDNCPFEDCHLLTH